MIARQGLSLVRLPVPPRPYIKSGTAEGIRTLTLTVFETVAYASSATAAQNHSA